ncbi:MAG: calmodulin-binding protein [Planctomycetales bacterium]|nr:calmodulin-binding protein [Planctomycetales bacterium]
MIRRTLAVFFSAAVIAGGLCPGVANAQQAYGKVWGNTYRAQDWERFYHYPYVYYPQNFWGNEYYRSAESLYFRYPPEMRVPVYNTGWHNYYPSGRRYHSGHHFVLDTF